MMKAENLNFNYHISRFVPANAFMLVRYIFLLLVLLSLSSCAVWKKTYNYDYLEGENQKKIVVSKAAPFNEFICTELGFLPCSLHNNVSPAAGKEYLQCARNILPYTENIGANYIYIREPINILGISWQDAKAQLYKCQWLPQPQDN